MAVSNSLKFLGVVALLGAGGYATARAISSTSPQGPPADTTGGPGAPTNYPSIPPSPGNTFPLVMGMKGNALVKALQKAILNKGGAPALEIQNSGGADGSFGPATGRALAALGAPQSTSVSEAYFNQLVYGTTAPGLPGATPSGTPPAPGPMPPTQVTIADVGQLQDDLKRAVSNRDAAAALKVLHQLKTPADYNALNDNGDGLHFWDSVLVNQTVVTKVLKTWPGDPRFDAAFSMCGLVKQGGTWQMPALAGLGMVNTWQPGSTWQSGITSSTPTLVKYAPPSSSGHGGFVPGSAPSPSKSPVRQPAPLAIIPDALGEKRRNALGDVPGDGMPPANW